MNYIISDNGFKKNYNTEFTYNVVFLIALHFYEPKIKQPKKAFKNATIPNIGETTKFYL